MRIFRKIAIKIRGGIPVKQCPPRIVESVEGSLKLSRQSLEARLSLEMPPGSRGFWINPGMSCRELRSELRIDPDTRLYRARWVFVEEEVAKAELSGTLIPFAGPWGFRERCAVLRCSLLWYPAVCSECSIVIPLMIGLHRMVRLELWCRDLEVASSVFVSREAGHYVLDAVGSVPPVDVVGVDGSCREYSVSGVGLRLVAEKGIDIDPVLLREVARACIELVKGLGLEVPYRSIDIAVHESGGFTNARLLSLNPSSARSRTSLLITVLRGFFRMWWGSIIRPREPSDAWLFEAVPEYLTTVSLLKLGLSELYQARLNKVFSEAFKQLASPFYIPPSSIALPLTKRGLNSWRFVGEAVLHMVGTSVGTNNMIEALVKIMRECQVGSRKPWVSLGDIVKEVQSFGDPTPILRRFKLV